MGLRLPINDDELVFHYVRASGPGGQNVNKVATAVELRFDVRRNRTLTPAVKTRLMALAGRRMTGGGELVIFAQRFRTRERNRSDAISRLQTLIGRAREAPKARRATRPTRASKLRRLESKHRLSDKKRLRQRSGEE